MNIKQLNIVAVFIATLATSTFFTCATSRIILIILCIAITNCTITLYTNYRTREKKTVHNPSTFSIYYYILAILSIISSTVGALGTIFSTRKDIYSGIFLMGIVLFIGVRWYTTHKNSPI